MKKTLLTLLVAFFAIPSCSNDTKECSEPSKCPQCETCDTCEVCAECPTCKDGDECPDYNTDALNSQLTSCNNELTTTKQELKTQKEANESCVGDLDSCNAEKNELSAKPRSKSGSRLIFKEHTMADGSVYVDPYPYDKKINKDVYLSDIYGFNNLSCFIDNTNPLSKTAPDYNTYYIDSKCTIPAINLNDSIFGVSLSYYKYYSCDYNDLQRNIGDLVYMSGSVKEINTCTQNETTTTKITMAKIVDIKELKNLY